MQIEIGQVGGGRHCPWSPAFAGEFRCPHATGCRRFAKPSYSNHIPDLAGDSSNGCIPKVIIFVYAYIKC